MTGPKRNYWTSRLDELTSITVTEWHHTEGGALSHACAVATRDMVPVNVYENRDGATVHLTTVQP